MGMEDAYYAGDAVAGGGQKQKQKKRQQNTIVPNTAFNAVIDAWSRSSFRFKAERANALLRRMEETQRERTDELASSNNKNENENEQNKNGKNKQHTDHNPRSILQRPRRKRRRPTLNLKPDIITYNSVLNAAATSFGDERMKTNALIIATDTYNYIQATPSLKPTSLTYSIYTKAVRKLIGDGDKREPFMPKIFKACVRDGMVNGYVLTQFELSYSGGNGGGGGGGRQERYRELLRSLGYSSGEEEEGAGDGVVLPVTMESIPDDWKRCTQRRR